MMDQTVATENQYQLLQCRLADGFQEFLIQSGNEKEDAEEKIEALRLEAASQSSAHPF